MNEVLIRKAKKGDKDAFCRLMDENVQSMYKVAAAYLKNDEDFVIVKCEYTAADGDAFLLGTQEEVPTLLLSTCGTDASKRLVVWCERQEEKGGQIGYSDEEAEVQEAGDDLAFLDGEFVENETHDFI